MQESHSLLVYRGDGVMVDAGPSDGLDEFVCGSFWLAARGTSVVHRYL